MNWESFFFTLGIMLILSSFHMNTLQDVICYIGWSIALASVASILVRQLKETNTK